MENSDLANVLDQAAAAISQADALLIGAGAGMGVDSGMPDFRGPEGFWRAYPALRSRNVRFEQMANPMWFEREPRLAWAFYGHRLHLYRETEPHKGFQHLLTLAAGRPLFVFTSNVDGQFQKAGFAEDHILEVHGSIHHLQRCDGAGGIWPADGVSVDIDPETFRVRGPLPVCPRTGKPARPNILMFGDGDWLSDRADGQYSRYQAFLQTQRNKRLVAIELGAGTAIPTVRQECALRSQTLVRINVRESQGGRTTLSLPMGALAATEQLVARM